MAVFGMSENTPTRSEVERTLGRSLDEDRPTLAPRTLRQAARTLEELAAELNAEARFAATPQGVGLRQALKELREARERDQETIGRLQGEREALRQVLDTIADGYSPNEAFVRSTRLTRKDMRRIAREAVDR